eukprot:sb/3473450/
MTEYCSVEAYQIERYLEDKNTRELYSIWSNKKLSTPSRIQTEDVRSSGDGGSNVRSNSYDDNTSLNMSNGSGPSNPSIYKAIKVIETAEYLELKKELELSEAAVEKKSGELASYQLKMENIQTQLAEEPEIRRITPRHSMAYIWRHQDKT